MSFRTFKVRYGPVMADPDVPGPRYHTIIFVETKSNGEGFIHHVTGDLVTGMKYERKEGRRPEASATFFDKTLLGSVAPSQYPKQLENVLRQERPPPPQKAFNTSTMRTEPIKPNGTFYAKHEARPKLVKCTEWTENQAIPALQRARLLTH